MDPASGRLNNIAAGNRARIGPHLKGKRRIPARRRWVADVTPAALRFRREFRPHAGRRDDPEQLGEELFSR
jgi:hypothetical protein